MLGLDKANYLVAVVALIVLFAVDCMQEKFVVRERLDKLPGVLQLGLCLSGIAAILIFGMYGPGIEMGAFVYTQF